MNHIPIIIVVRCAQFCGFSMKLQRRQQHFPSLQASSWSYASYYTCFKIWIFLCLTHCECKQIYSSLLIILQFFFYFIITPNTWNISLNHNLSIGLSFSHITISNTFFYWIIFIQENKRGNRILWVYPPLVNW